MGYGEKRILYEANHNLINYDKMFYTEEERYLEWKTEHLCHKIKYCTKCKIIHEINMNNFIFNKTRKNYKISVSIGKCKMR